MIDEVCDYNRFEIIEKAKQDLLESTNIQTSEDEMKVIDDFLFRCWQMGWLEKYEQPKADWIPCEDEEEPCITKEFSEECKEVAKKYERPIMRDDFGRCKMRGCNLCDKYRKELEADKWIPCETELPPQPNENPLYENKPLEVYLVSVENWEEPIRAFWNGNDFTDGWSKLKVEAWMPLPQPYKKEGAEDEK